MTKLDELIQQLCPDGVKYYTLNTICNVYDGTHQTPQYTDSGIKFASVENIADPYATEKYISVSDYEKYKIKPHRNDLLMTRIGSIGVCTVIESDEPLAYYVSLALLRPDNSILNSRYLKYAIESLHCRKELRKRTLVNAVPIKINMGDIGKITLPVPPLPVQREIVRILDNFTELTARKKQYAYYRDKLLAFGDDVPKDTLENLCDFQYGKGNSIPTVPGEYPVYGCNGVVGTTNVFNSIDAPVIGHIGSAGIVNWGKGKHFVTYNGTICKVRPEKMISRYAYHLLCSLHLERFVKGSQPFLSYSDFAKETVAVPPLNIQQRVVSILDRFDTLCTDLSSGLPAEIEARQKQYEYYRDKLLTFKTMSN